MQPILLSMWENMNYDKNGNGIMAIYCWHCSDNKHANMRRGQGKGHGKLIGTRYDKEGNPSYKFKCKICQFDSLWEPKSYVEQYGIR